MIAVHGLTKRYGSTQAVSGLSFRIRRGVVTGFLGPNGAGKTTTMRLILGLDRPSAGNVTIDGKPHQRSAAPMHEVGALLDARAVPRRISIIGLVLCLAGSVLAVARWSPAGTAPPGGVLAAAAGLAGTALAAWVLGDSVAYRYRRAYYASVEERAARLEAERDAQARIAAAAERARELQDRRARAVDESAARLRRIERDLHDGAQVRLTALAMTLGEIKETLDQAAPGDGDRIRLLVGTAHANAKETLTELRDLARGIHPPALDRGLGPALSSLAETSPVPVELTASTRGSPSPAIEAIAYFCAAELLANVAKHSGATHAAIDLGDGTGRLRLAVTDNGAGGAHLAPGGGLAGLLGRVQTVDGHLDVSSPPGGPTRVTLDLPRHA